jgi:hypothetical protein
VHLLRGALRLDEAGLAELQAQIERLAGRLGNADAEGVWTRVVVALVDLQPRPAPGNNDLSEPMS